MSFLLTILLVMFGGALGAGSRFCIQQACYTMGWPLIGTLLVNISGSFLAGALVFLTVEHLQAQAHVVRPFLLIGFLGGLTTFSAMSVDVLQLTKDLQYIAAGLHILLNVLLSIFAVFAGFFITQLISQAWLRI